MFFDFSKFLSEARAILDIRIFLEFSPANFPLFIFEK